MADEHERAYPARHADEAQDRRIDELVQQINDLRKRMDEYRELQIRMADRLGIDTGNGIIAQLRELDRRFSIIPVNIRKEMSQMERRYNEALDAFRKELEKQRTQRRRELIAVIAIITPVAFSTIMQLM